MRNLLIAAVLFLAATACSAHNHSVKAYTPQRMEIVSSRAEIQAMVAGYVFESGWELLAQDNANGRVVALSPNVSQGETMTRERWTFRAYDGWLEVQMRFEASFDPGVWVASPWICDTYSYSREYSQLHAVAARAAENRLTVANGSAIARR